MECIKKKKDMMWIYFIVPALILAFAISMLIPQGIDNNLTDHEGAHYEAPLYTLSDDDWATTINSKTIDDATTTCTKPTTEGNHHVMYCDKIAGSDTEISFKTFFRSRVKNYKITEIKEVTKSRITNQLIGTPYACSENKNGTCYSHKLEEVNVYYKTQEELPLTANIKDNDWELSAKRLYVADEKRTYKLEWDDIAPTQTKPITTDLGNGIKRTTFPIVQSYYNEVSINPTETWNYTVNQWGGVASNTILNDDGSIIADNTSTAGDYPDYLQDLSAGLIKTYMNSTALLNLGTGSDGTNSGAVVTTGVTSINDRGALQFDGVDDRVSFDNTPSANVGTGFVQFWIYPEAGLKIGEGANIILDLGGRAYIMGNCTVCGDVSKAGVRWYNAGDGGAYNQFELIYNEWQLLTMKWNASGHYLYQNTTLIFSDSLTGGVDFCGYPIIVSDNKDKNGAKAFKMKMQELYYSTSEISMQEIEDSYFTAGSLIYGTSGNRTLDGYAPNYPDQYEITGAGFSQIDNDASNYGGLTIKYNNDNSTWQTANELSYLDIIGTQASSFQMIPNITTDTTTTPQIYSAWIDYKSLIYPTINIEYPTNTTYHASSVDLNVSSYDLDGIDSMWFSNDTGINNYSIAYPENITLEGLSSQSYRIDVWVNDTSNLFNTSSISFYINNPPTIPVLTSPENATFHSSIPALVVNNSEDIDPTFYYFEIANLSDFLIVDRASGNIAEGVTTTSWTPTYLADGNYSWRALATDTYGNSSWSAEVRNIILDTTAPTVNDIGNVSNLLTVVLPVNSAINITATDSNLRDCWYYTSDSATNVSITCNSATYTDISWATEGSKTIYGCANDSIGLSACISESLYVDYYSVSQSSSSSVVSEGGQVSFNLTINKVGLELDYDLTNAVLLLNNTQYASSKTSFSNGSQFIVDLFVLDGWGNVTGIPQSWNWGYAIYNATSTLINSTTAPQTLTVYDAGLDDCSSYGNIILNFTLYDEEDKTQATDNITIETTATLMNPFNSDYLFNYSTSVSTNSMVICASDNFLNYTDFNLSTITRYEFEDHVIEYHYIDNYNQSGSTTQAISLYDLKTADSTSFLITYKDEYYLPVEGAVVDVWRYYVSEGIYRSVEHGKTSDEGETRAHLVTEDVKYIFKVRKGGKIIYNSPEYLAICQATPCQINLATSTDDIDYKDFGTTDNLEYSLTTNTDDRTVVLTFSTLDGSPAVMKMNVTKSDAFYNETACENTLTSSGGTITCDVAVTRGNTTFDIWVWKDEEFVAFDSFSLVPNADDTFGQTGMLLAIIIIITLPLMAITSGIAMVVFILVGVVMAGLLTLLTGGSILGAGSSIIWLICAGIILIVKMSKRRYA